MTTQIVDTDTEAIIETASDYYGGYYEADPGRIARSLHPDLAKRGLRKDDQGQNSLRHLDKNRMVEITRQGGGSDIPVDKRDLEVIILDRYEEMASVKVVAYPYIDYLHLVKDNGRWLIVNALWTDNRAHKGM